MKNQRKKSHKREKRKNCGKTGQKQRGNEADTGEENEHQRKKTED